MIRICHIQVLPLLSGVQRVMLDIFKRLDSRRFEPHVVCKEQGPLTDELRRLGIACHLLPSLDRPIRPGKDLRAYRQCRQLFRDQRFDIVHTHSSKPGILGRLAARHAGVPCVVHHVHGFAFHDYSSAATRLLYARLERWAGQYCDRVLFVNHEERELAIRQGILPAVKCQTVYNGVDLDRYSGPRRQADRGEIRGQYRLTESETAILMMGRLDRQKQPLLIPRIAQQLERLAPQSPWRILVAGSGSQQAALESLVDKLGLRHRVQLLGWQPQPERLFCAADVVLHPTLWEGLPLSLLDAQGAGLPSVVSDIKGNREVVTPETGFVCDPQDAMAYAKALKQLIDQPGMRDRLGRAARQRAMQCFDAEKNYRQIAALYDELLGSPRQSTGRQAA